MATAKRRGIATKQPIQHDGAIDVAALLHTQAPQQPCGLVSQVSFLLSRVSQTVLPLGTWGRHQTQATTTCELPALGRRDLGNDTWGAIPLLPAQPNCCLPAALVTCLRGSANCGPARARGFAQANSHHPCWRRFCCCLATGTTAATDWLLLLMLLPRRRPWCQLGATAACQLRR